MGRSTFERLAEVHAHNLLGDRVLQHAGDDGPPGTAFPSMAASSKLLGLSPLARS